MSFYKRYTQFIQTHYRYFIFISLFYSVWLVSRVYYSDKLELQNFPGRMIGEATVNGIDVVGRVNVFYECAGLFILFNLASSLLAFFLMKKEQIFHFSEFKIIHFTSLAGIIIYVYKLFFPAVDSVFDLIYALQKVALLLLVLKLFMWNDKSSKLFDVTLFSLLSVAALCCYFFVKEIAVLFTGNSFNPGMFNLMSLCMLLGYTLVGFVIRNCDHRESEKKLLHLFYILLPLTLLPILSVLKNEIYLILNHHGIFSITPKKIYLSFIGILAIWIFLRRRKVLHLKEPLNHSLYRLLSNRYFPFLILSLTSFLYYRPVVDASKEMFELANRALPLMEWQKFGTLPLLEKFNAHFLSDVFFGFIYLFLNGGIHGLDFLAYDFLFPVMGAVLSYWLILKLSNNAYVAVFFVLFFPIAQAIVPEYFSLGLIAIFILHKVLEANYSLKNYLMLWGSVILLMLWRLDIGYSVLICYLIIPLVYYLHKRTAFFNNKTLFRSLGLVASILLLFLFSFYLMGIPVFETIRKTLSFLSSSQGYGYSNLGDATTILFKMQHYFFPLLVLLLAILLIIRFYEFSVSRQQRFVFLTLLFLICFYLFNFQRGLVRHSFKEETDLFLSSFLFLILSGSTYLFLYQRSHLLKFMVFIASSSFLVFNYSFPNITKANPLFNYRYQYSSGMACVFNDVKSKTDAFPELISRKSFDRCPMTSEFKKDVFGSLQTFMDSSLRARETFLDFSNSPMLYYYLQKETPSFFYHNPFHLCNDYLQKDFIKGLSKYEAPLLIYSHYPESWFDNLDGPPNALKHYRVAEYFYSHYEPFVIVNNYCLWKKTGDNRFKNPSRIVFRFDSVEKEKIRLDSFSRKTFFRSYVKANAGKKYFFKVAYKPKNYEDLGFYYFNLPYSSRIQGISPAFVDGLGYNAYYVIEPKAMGRFSFYVYNIKNIVSLELIEADELPDFYSPAPRSWNLGKLPSLWANYDDSITEAKSLVVLCSKSEPLRKGLQIQYSMPSSIDKSSGNYIHAKIHSNNTSSMTLKISYGNANRIAGEFLFTVSPGKEAKEFVVRVSSQYNWYSPDNNTISIEAYPNGGEEIRIDELSLLKGN